MIDFTSLLHYRPCPKCASHNLLKVQQMKSILTALCLLLLNCGGSTCPAGAPAPASTDVTSVTVIAPESSGVAGAPAAPAAPTPIVAAPAPTPPVVAPATIPVPTAAPTAATPVPKADAKKDAPKLAAPKATVPAKK